jgi:hypothetical protein
MLSSILLAKHEPRLIEQMQGAAHIWKPAGSHHLVSAAPLRPAPQLQGPRASARAVPDGGVGMEVHVFDV